MMIAYACGEDEASTCNPSSCVGQWKGIGMYDSIPDRQVNIRILSGSGKSLTFITPSVIDLDIVIDEWNFTIPTPMIDFFSNPVTASGSGQLSNEKLSYCLLLESPTFTQSCNFISK